MNYLKIYFVLSILITEHQCGLVDSMFGSIKNTTNEVKSGVGDLFSFGKGLVFGGNKQPNGNAVVEEKKSIIGGFIDSVHQTVHNVHQKVHNTIWGGDKSGTKGLLGNIVDRIQHKAAKVKEFITGGEEKRKQMISDTHSKIISESKIGRETVHKFFFGNSTSQHGAKLRKIIKSMKGKIQSIIGNDTTVRPIIETTTVDNENTDGSNLIDIRMASDNLARNLNEDITRTKNRFNKGIDELNKNVAMNKNYIDNSVKDNLNKQKEAIEGEVKKINEEAIVFRD